MKDVKNIIFDFGGVLVNLDKQRALDSFKALGFDATPYLGLYAQSGIFAAHESGDISDEEFLDAIKCHTEACGTDTYGTDACNKDACEASREAKAEAWCSMLTDVPSRRREAILRLRQTHRTFLLSNTNGLHWRMSLQRWWEADGHKTSDYFERTFLSYEMHQCKPGTEIFATALREAGLKPEETLFIDDSQKNCDAAATLGLRTLCATGDEWMGCVATIGHFDGVHTGHRYLIDRVKSEADRRGLWSMLITFDRHPREVTDPLFVPQNITSHGEKLRLLHATGVDEVEVLHFDKAMSQMSARDFLIYIKESLGVRVLLVGHDHRFGHNSADTVADYKRYGEEAGVEVLAVEAMPGEHVSSSAVRRLLQSGDVEQASQLLGRPYTLTATVITGHQIGRQLGFPTANLSVHGQILPARGVYAARCMNRVAVVNIGHRPTVDDGAMSVEVHIPGFDGNLYGQTLSVTLLRYLRAERHFASLDDLRRQIALDIAAAGE